MRGRGPGRLRLTVDGGSAAAPAPSPSGFVEVRVPADGIPAPEAAADRSPPAANSWDRFLALSHEVPAVAARWPDRAEALSLVFDLIEEALSAPYDAPPTRTGMPRGPAMAAEDGRFTAALDILQASCRKALAEGTGEEDCARLIARGHQELEALLQDAPAGKRPRPRSPSSVSRRAVHEAELALLSARLSAAAAPRFVERRVLRWIGIGPQEGRLLPCTATIVREIGTGRATIRYGSGKESLAFAKIFTDGAQAEHSYRVQRALWEHGLNDASDFRVPEPLAFVPEMGLVLSRAAPGRALSDLFEEGAPNLEEYARRAAAWLVDLHASPVRVGGLEPLWRSMWLVRLLRRLSKAAAKSPTHREELVGLVERLHAFGARTFREVPPVQAHGTYHFEHVLIARDSTAVLDFDRSFPTDPAKDLAEFVRFMRWRTFAHTGSVALAEGPTRAFLREYTRAMPEHAANLPVYWAAFMLMNLFRRVARHEQEASFEVERAFFRQEFDSILSGASLRGS